MSNFADQLAAAQLIALERLVKIVQHSDNDKEARLAAVAILKLNERRGTGGSPVIGRPAAESSTPNSRPPSSRSPEPSVREITALISAMEGSMDAFARHAQTPNASAPGATTHNPRAP